MNVTGVLEPILQRNIRQPGDYTDADGLLYCGTCHRQKQIHGMGYFAGRLLPVPCACEEARGRAEAERDRQLRVEELRRQCLSNEETRTWTFAKADETRIINIARRYTEKWRQMQEENCGLLFWGNTSTGKSYAAYCIANALLDKEIRVAAWDAMELVALLGEREQREETLLRVRSAPLMILDDLGAERDTPYAREQICAAINTRLESGKPLIVTTNYSLEEMKNGGDRTMQRIFERLDALCVPVKATGESRRQEIGAGKLAAARELLR